MSRVNRQWHMRKRGVAMIGLVLFGSVQTGYGQTAPVIDLSALSLEDLMDVKVTSVSRKEQTLKDTAAAVFVVTQEDIRRSGYTTLPEVLRMVPGLEVARINGHQWAITARGFNGLYANKLLVLLDGRPLYDPTFSGVLWEDLDVVMEDIDRIEVIRGPGATMWGANAVNGVISIFTRHAGSERGGLVSVESGNSDRATATARWEGQAGDLGYRLYVRDSLRNQDFTEGVDGSQPDGPWHSQHAGGRLDWKASAEDSFSIEAEAYRSALDETLAVSFPTPPYGALQPFSTRYESGDVTVRWNHKSSDTSELSLQFFYDQHDLDQSNATASAIGEGAKMADLDFQYRTQISSRQELIWGAGFRYSVNNQRNSFSDSFLPPHRADPLYTAFAQDEISLTPSTLKLTLGSKIEHNNYTGVEVQPSARLFWALNNHEGLWTSVARAVSTPSRVYTDLVVNSFSSIGPNGLPIFVQFNGNPGNPSEQMIAYEAGYRRHAKRYAMDIAAFLNQYQDVRDLESLAPVIDSSDGPPRLVIPFEYFPTIHGFTYGVELSAYWNPTEHWRLSGSETLLLMDLADSSVGTPIYPGAPDGASPTSQFQVHSGWDVARRLEFDTSIYYVGRIRSLLVPAYTTVDIRMGWKFRRGLDLSAGVQNLLNDRHLEFVPDNPAVPSVLIGRTANLKITYRL